MLQLRLTLSPPHVLEQKVPTTPGILKIVTFCQKWRIDISNQASAHVKHPVQLKKRIVILQQWVPVLVSFIWKWYGGHIMKRRNE